MKYKHRYAVKLMCKVLKISESGYYRWLKNKDKPSKRHLLLVTINEILSEHYEETGDFTPDKSYLKEIPMNGMNIEDITVTLIAENDKVLIAYETYIRGQKQPIEPRMPVLRPCEIETVEELYINGLHLEQYKQHNYNSCDYYLEGIKRDSGDIRCNTAMARYSFKNGQFDKCIEYADVAIERLTSRNQHPSDVEAFYLKGRFAEARNVLEEMLDTAENSITNCDRRTYYGVGSPSPLPFEDDIVKNNLLSGYTLKAYALLGLGKFNEAEKYINKAKQIQMYEFPIYAFDEIKKSVMELI